jgi:hypothetical protein
MECTRQVAAAVTALTAVAVAVAAPSPTAGGPGPAPVRVAPFLPDAPFRSGAPSPPDAGRATVLASGSWWGESFMAFNRAW